MAPYALILMGDWCVPVARQPRNQEPGRVLGDHDRRRGDSRANSENEESANRSVLPLDTREANG